MNSILEINYWIFHILHNLTFYFPQINVLVYIIAERIDMYVVLLGVFFILIHRHGTQLNRPMLLSRTSLLEGIYTCLGISIAWLASFLMKASFAIARPFIEFSDIIPLFLYGGNDSFPSGHATLFAALAVAIYLHHRKVGAVFIFFAFCIALARVISGVHFPIDIIVGWILGGGISYLVYRYMHHYHSHLFSLPHNNENREDIEK